MLHQGRRELLAVRVGAVPRARRLDKAYVPEALLHAVREAIDSG